MAWHVVGIALLILATACGSSSGTATAPTPAPTTEPPTTVPVATDPPTTAASTSAPTTLPAAPTSAGMTEAAATAVAVGIIDAYNSKDLTFVGTTMGNDGSWVGVEGQQIEGSKAIDFLTPLLPGIDRTDILGNGVKVADGWAFPLREFRSSVPFDYGIVIGTNDAGGTRVEEVYQLPAPTKPPAVCTVPAPGMQRVTMNINGVDETVRVFVPSATMGTVLPTVIDWHASGDTGDVEAEVTGYEDVAEKNGFIVVHPDHDTPDYSSHPDFETNSATIEAPDIAFANGLIDELEAHWCADPARIYVTGYSLGSLFTARLVCGLSDRIAGAVSVGGTFHTDDCAPKRAVPYMAFHGTADPVIPYDDNTKPVYGGDPGFMAQAPRTEFEQFAAAAGCSTDSVDTEPASNVIRHAYHGCADGTDRIFYEIVGGGHTWPGSTTSQALYAGLTLGAYTDEINATEVSWDFLRHYHLNA